MPVDDFVWPGYARQSGRQWGGSSKYLGRVVRPSRSRRVLMRPGPVLVSWPGWDMAGVRSWW